VIVHALDSLASQARAPQEIVVVDQSDEPNEPLARRSGIIYVRDPGRGAPRAKNVGIQRSTGDILLFLDDDSVARPGLVEAHVRNYADSGVSAVAGRVLCPDDPPLEPGTVIGRLNLRDLSMTANFHGTVRTEVDHVYGCNWSVRRSVLEDVGGFDESLQPDGRGTAFFEEAELSIRIRRAGCRIVFDPAAVAEHRKAPTGGCRPADEREWCYWFYRNKAVLFRRYGAWCWLPWFLTRQLVSIARRALSSGGTADSGRLRLVACCLRALRDGWGAAFADGRRAVTERPASAGGPAHVGAAASRLAAPRQ
jgi:GT2 family glycosyltransferase